MWCTIPINVIFVLYLSACSQESQNKDTFEIIEFEYISQGNWFTYGAKLNTPNPAYQLFNDSQSWLEFWHQISSGPIPEIDFSDEFVLLVYQGNKPTGGYGIEISQVEIDNLWIKLNIIAKFKEPGPNDAVDLGETNPYAIVKLHLPDNTGKMIKDSKLTTTFYEQIKSTRTRIEVKQF